MTGLGRHELRFVTLQPVTRAIREPELMNLACYLFERPRSASHHAAEKPFATDGRVKLDPADDGSTVVTVAVNWFDPSVNPRPIVEAALSETPNLGRDLPLRPLSWTVRPRAMPTEARGRRQASIEFVTPTTMKARNGKPTVRPTGAALMRGISRRYSRYIRQVPRWVADMVDDVSWTPDRSGRNWFTGVLEVRLTAEAPKPAAVWFDQLLAFAELCGAGSSIRSGRGTLVISR